MEILIKIIAIMIAYDLSIHIVYLLGYDKKILESGYNWWPNFKKYYKNTYQYFWVSYWGIAFVLSIIYLVYGL